MEVVREERNVSEMRAEERERWKKGSSKLSHETLQMALQFPEAAHGRGQQEPSKGEAAPAPPHPLSAWCWQAGSQAGISSLGPQFPYL